MKYSGKYFNVVVSGEVSRQFRLLFEELHGL
jgi:hypothetical protein